MNRKWGQAINPKGLAQSPTSFSKILYPKYDELVAKYKNTLACGDISHSNHNILHINEEGEEREAEDIAK